MGHGGFLCALSWARAMVAEALAAITTLGALLEVTGTDLQEATEMGAHLGWRLRRNVNDYWATGKPA